MRGHNGDQQRYEGQGLFDEFIDDIAELLMVVLGVVFGVLLLFMGIDQVLGTNIASSLLDWLMGLISSPSEG